MLNFRESIFRKESASGEILQAYYHLGGFQNGLLKAGLELKVNYQVFGTFALGGVCFV